MATGLMRTAVGTGVLILLMSAIGAAPLRAEALPSVAVNCSAGPVALGSDTPLSLILGLHAGTAAGAAADWWLAAETPFGLLYETPGGGWTLAADADALRPFHQGPLFDLPPTEILQVTGLAPGTYRVYFAIDSLQNGRLDFDQLQFAAVDVIIPTHSEAPAASTDSSRADQRLHPAACTEH